MSGFSKEYIGECAILHLGMIIPFLGIINPLILSEAKEFVIGLRDTQSPGLLASDCIIIKITGFLYQIWTFT